MEKQRTLFQILLLLTIAIALRAEDPPRDTALNDPFLENLIGDWNVERTMGSGRKEKNVVRAEWILHHQFVELHYRDPATPSRYEAIVVIGYDGIAKRYLCHWADVFGGDYSADGYATRDEASDAMEFKFTFHDGELTNRYAFDSKSGTWTSTIRQVEKGEWKLFCEDKFARAAAK